MRWVLAHTMTESSRVRSMVLRRLKVRTLKVAMPTVEPAGRGAGVGARGGAADRNIGGSERCRGHTGDGEGVRARLVEVTQVNVDLVLSTRREAFDNVVGFTGDEAPRLRTRARSEGGAGGTVDTAGEAVVLF